MVENSPREGGRTPDRKTDNNYCEPAKDCKIAQGRHCYEPIGGEQPNEYLSDRMLGRKQSDIPPRMGCHPDPRNTVHGNKCRQGQTGYSQVVGGSSKDGPSDNDQGQSRNQVKRSKSSFEKKQAQRSQRKYWDMLAAAISSFYQHYCKNRHQQYGKEKYVSNVPIGDVADQWLLA